MWSKGRGYNIKLPTSSLRTIVPALRWGLFFLKAGLATQGLGSVVPDLASILHVIDDAYIRSIETAIISSVQPALDLTKIDNFDQVMNQTLDSITDEQDQAAFNFLADFLMEKEKYQGTNIQEWEPQYTGLHKEVSEYDGSCMWVSEESKQEFLERGLDALVEAFCPSWLHHHHHHYLSSITIIIMIINFIITIIILFIMITFIDSHLV